MLKIRNFCNLIATRLLKKNFGIKHFSTKSRDDESVISDAIKYSASPASKYKAKFTRTGTSEPRLWYEPYVILTSLTVFLIYFAILREENDIDEELNTSLYSRIAGLEEHQLKLSLEYNKQNGLDTEAIVNRLKEIEQQKVTVE